MNNLPVMFEYQEGHMFNLCDICTITILPDSNKYLYQLRDKSDYIYLTAEQHETVMKVLQTYHRLETAEICDLVLSKVLEYQRKYLDNHFKD